MSSYNQVVDFLPEGTQLMVAVKPPADLASELKKFLINDLEDFPYKKGVSVVPLQLKEPLRIKFSISSQWNIQRELEECVCVTPVVSEKKLKSVNGAYQAISGILEPNRNSVGGKVYTNVFFRSENEVWTPLEARRDFLYEPCKADYEEKVSIYKDKTLPYAKPHPAIKQFFQALLDQKENLLQTLKSENQDLLVQVQKLNEIFKQSKLAVYKEKIDEFEQRLKENHPETAGENSWQVWIYKNNWLFATQYGEPLTKKRVGFHSIPDFLFPTLDGFIDVLEIKKPTFEVIDEDSSHHGSYKWSKEANEAIGQVVNYLYEIELHQLEIVKRIEDNHSIRLSAIKPRGIILVGKSDKWAQQKREALRKLNHSLHNIEIMTYTDLLRRGKSLISIYDDSE